MINSGNEIFEKVCATYAALDSYSDIGTASTFSEQVSRNKRFKTYFVRPDNFRFECHPLSSSKPDVITNNFSIWSNGKHFSCSAFEETKQYDEFLMIIAAATGVSIGAVDLILSLIKPDFDVDSQGSLKAKKWMELSDQRVDSSLYSHLVSSDGIEMWIDKGTNMIGRVIKHSISEELSESKIELLRESLNSVGMLPETINSTVSKISNLGPTAFRDEYNYTETNINPILDHTLFDSSPK